MILGPWENVGPDYAFRRDAEGIEVARIWRDDRGWWWRTRDHEGQSPDARSGAEIRAAVALSSVRRPLSR